MIYAQIKEGMIYNTIVLDDLELGPHFSEGFEYFLDITDIDPQPGIGWSYDGEVFTAPPPPPDEGA